MVSTASPSSSSTSTMRPFSAAILAFSEWENNITGNMTFVGRSHPIRAIPIELANRYEKEGWWTQDRLGDLLARGLAAHPDAAFCVHWSVRPITETYRDFDRMARRLAVGLRARGGGPGYGNAFQLPNWM